MKRACHGFQGSAQPSVGCNEGTPSCPPSLWSSISTIPRRILKSHDNQKRCEQLDPDEFRGLVLRDQYAPVVFLNDADTKSTGILTLAHELVHVWLERDGVFNLDNRIPAKEETE